MYHQATQHLLEMEEIDNSFKHKLKRIQQEAEFREANLHKFRQLTHRETEILYLVVNDRNNPQIAEELYISRFTVEQHRKNINRKLGANTYKQLFQYALAFDLV